MPVTRAGGRPRRVALGFWMALTALVGCVVDLPLCVDVATPGSMFELETVALVPSDGGAFGVVTGEQLLDGSGSYYLKPPCDTPFFDGPGTRIIVGIDHANAWAADSRDPGACQVLRCASIIGFSREVMGGVQDLAPSPPPGLPYGPNYCGAVTGDGAEFQLVSFDGDTGVIVVSFGGSLQCGEAWRVRFLPGDAV